MSKIKTILILNLLVVIGLCLPLELLSAPTWKKVTVSGGGGGGNLVTCSAVYSLSVNNTISVEIVLPEAITMYYILKGDDGFNSSAELNGINSYGGTDTGNYHERRGQLTVNAGQSVTLTLNRSSSPSPTISLSYQASGGCFLTGLSLQ